MKCNTMRKRRDVQSGIEVKKEDQVEMERMDENVEFSWKRRWRREEK